MLPEVREHRAYNSFTIKMHQVCKHCTCIKMSFDTKIYLDAAVVTLKGMSNSHLKEAEQSVCAANNTPKIIAQTSLVTVVNV